MIKESLRYTRASVSSFVYGFLCVGAILVWFLFACLTVPLYCLYRLFKSLQAALVRYYNMGKILASRDVPFLHETENNRNFISGIFVVNGTPNFEALKALLMARVIGNTEEPSYARMRKRVTKRYGRYVWEDEEHFDIEKHTRLCDGPGPCSEQELQETLSALISEPIPQDISPWLFIVLPLNMGKEQFGVCMRIHHAIGDGFSMVGLFARMVDHKPQLLRVQKPVTTPCDKNKQVWKAILTGPLALLNVALSSLADNPFPVKREMSGEKILSWTKPLDLERVKEIKTRTGTTVNDVLSACLAGALRRYLFSEGLNDPKDLQIAVTINTRPPNILSRDHIPLENHSTGVLFSLPVGGKSSYVRLMETKRRMDCMKASTDWKIFGFVYSYIVGTLPEFIGRFSSFSLNKHCCLILSNVPGPLRPLVIDGDEVETAIAWPPLVSDTSMSIAMFSYAGHLRMSVLTDKAVLTDPRKLTENFVQEFQDMYDQTKSAPFTSAPRNGVYSPADDKKRS